MALAVSQKCRDNGLELSAQKSGRCPGPFEVLVVVRGRMERLEEERSLPGCSNAMLQEIMGRMN